MEFSTNFIGGYFSKTININKFKTDYASINAYDVRTSKVNERCILDKLKSINPNVDVSKVAEDMKLCETELQKHNFQDLFESPSTVSTRCLLPIYTTIKGDLRTLEVVKSDLYQKKRTKLYTPLPNFTPRGNITPGKTVLITVSFYYPFHWVKNQDPDEAVIPRCKDVIQFYDTQTLVDLKNGFKCENSESEISGDISKNPYKPLEFIANSDLKHTLFYINNNIYVDSLPDAKTIAHSKNMKSWAEKTGHPIGDILSIDTNLSDLEVRIGQPYIYQHLGRCEHLFIFNEISFAQYSDCLGQNNYPRIISIAKEKLKNCIFCNKSIAKFVMVSHDIRTPVTVNHMCESCYMSFNYDHIGDKVTNFKAYRTLKWRK